jgi:hypothetical protein
MVGLNMPNPPLIAVDTNVGDLLEQCHVGKLLIFSPAKIVAGFFNSAH